MQELQEKATKVDEVQSSFDSYKRYVGIKDLSLGFLNEAGAQLNPQSKIYNLQMQAIQNTLSQVQYQRYKRCPLHTRRRRRYKNKSRHGQANDA